MADTLQMKATNLPCVAERSDARFVGYAYNHIVYLDNRCAYPIACRISTDVNPTPVTVRLAPKEKKQHLTFRGSPAGIFKASISCKKAN